MKAIVYKSYGSPDVLNYADVAKPIPKNNEVLIKVATGTVTAGDTRMRSFDVPLSFWIPARLVLGVFSPKNKILGMEMAGVVEAVGKDVTKFKVGDAVFGSTMDSGFGGYAEYKCLPEHDVLAIKLDDVSFEDAVTLPIGARTALYFLREATIRAGQKVVIYGASGSVGTFAVQLAKLYGAEVTAVSTTKNHPLLKSLGADKVLDYTKQDFTQTGEQYDVIFDTVGKTNYTNCLRTLKPNGAYLHAVSGPSTSLRMAWTRRRTNLKLVGGGPPPNSDDLNYLQTLIAEGKLKVVIDRRYQLDQMIEAHQYVDNGRKKGNVITITNSHT